MTLETYGLSEKEYLDILEKKSLFTLKAFSRFLKVSKDNSINLEHFTDKFIWDMFQEIIYSSDDEARIKQKEVAPEEVKRRQYDSVLIPSHEDLMGEVQSINAKVEALTDYISTFVGKFN